MGRKEEGGRAKEKLILYRVEKDGVRKGDGTEIGAKDGLPHSIITKSIASSLPSSEEFLLIRVQQDMEQCRKY